MVYSKSAKGLISRNIDRVTMKLYRNVQDMNISFNSSIVITYFLYYLLLLYCRLARYVKLSATLPFLCKNHPNPLYRSINPYIFSRCLYLLINFILLWSDLNPSAMDLMEFYPKCILLRDDSIVLLLMLIFNNILTTGVYPEMWRLGNVNLIHKNVSKQLPILKISH